MRTFLIRMFLGSCSTCSHVAKSEYNFPGRRPGVWCTIASDMKTRAWEIDPPQRKFYTRESQMFVDSDFCCINYTEKKGE